MTSEATSPRFLILLSGDLVVTDRLRAQMNGARVIAADSGMRHAAGLGAEPELWVGDFDSSDEALLDAWPEIERQPFPAAKNATDGEIAVEAALARGARSVILAGALGGERSDHALAHFTHAMALCEAGIDVLLTSGTEEAVPLPAGESRFDLPAGSLFSVVAFSAIDALTIAGARYPLDRFDAAFGATRTISNVAAGPVTISHEGGRAMLVARPYDFSGA
jgi:thiamine pyrophosphokinase